MKELSELGVPKEFWKFFGQILTIPRCSEHEDQIRSYIKQKAVSFGYQVREDEIGNLMVDKDEENEIGRKTLIFQSHLDMVCEKNSVIEHDFSSDEIETEVIEINSERWLTAKGTTLGGDNGVGIAYSLTLMEKIHKKELNINGVNLAFLFTVQEENGLIGAINIEDNFIKGNYLINLDSEEDDRFTIGCAGGINTLGLIEMKKEEIAKVWNKTSSLKIKIKGLQGGHSGVDINKGRANAIKILAKILWKINNKFYIRIKTIKGGNLPNAIPREAEATFYVQKSTVSDIEEFFNQIKSEIELGISSVEPDMEILLTQIEDDDNIDPLTEELNERLLHILYIMPNGPISTHPSNPDLVYTSTNLASIKTEGTTLKITTSQRSLHEISKTIMYEKIVSLFKLADMDIKIEFEQEYPGWAPDFDSKLLKVAKETYIEIFNEEPIVQTIHAGLECGILKSKFPDIEMISLGPNIKDAHSPDERLMISSVEKIWGLSKSLVKNLN